jgi:hypothetical protein
MSINQQVKNLTEGPDAGLRGWGLGGWRLKQAGGHSRMFILCFG